MHLWKFKLDEMANEEQLRILNKEGVQAWNEWRKDNRDVEIDLEGANLNYAYLEGANLNYAYLEGANLYNAQLERAQLNYAQLNYAYLEGANLEGANLNGANLNGANLEGAYLEGAHLEGAHLNYAYLEGANLNGANLTDANLNYAQLERAYLEGAQLYGAYLNYAQLERAYLEGANLEGAYLEGAHLEGAHLEGADLTGADLTGADLKGAHLKGAHLTGQNLNGKDLSGNDLSEANLTRFQALGTNFSSANLTGACIEDWNINSKTNFDNVICDYIYLKQGQKERRPSDPNRNFEPGDFAKLVEQSLETVDLIFTEGIDWRAFLPSFQDLQVKYGKENVSIRAIEQKSDGAFVIRLNVPPDADDAKKAEIESRAKESYTKLAVLEAENRLLLKQNASLENIVYKLADKPINVEAKAVSETGDTFKRTINTNTYYEQTGPQGIGHMSGGTIGEGADVAGVINKVEAKNLTEVATKIEKLLDYFEQNDPSITQAQQIVKTATEEQPEILDAEIVKEAIKATPTLRQRIGAAGTAAYIETVKTLLPPFGIAYEAYMAFKNPG